MAIMVGSITIGALMVVSALRGVSITDLLRGVTGDTLSPHGGSTAPVSGAEVLDPSAGAPDIPNLPAGRGADPQGTYSGPNGMLLRRLESVATGQFHLRISSRGRSLAENIAAGGASGSYHLRNRAFDASGPPADMAAYYRYVASHYPTQVAELFYDPIGALKNGHAIPPVGGHSDHVHTAA